MLGMEKNSDLVKMCSYAPLLFNVHRLDWPVNMIGYDSAVAFGRTSYWGQRLFASNLPDVNLATEAASPRVFTLSPPGGLIGVGTWNTQAEPCAACSAAL
jgi:alpha-L-arabinofuranosidase